MTSSTRADRAGPARPGFVHDALLFDGEADLLDTAVAFAEEAAATGEQIAVACSERHNRVVADALGDVGDVSILDRDEVYGGAAAAIDYYRRFADRTLAAGRRGIRFLSEVPFGDDPSLLREWGRFEAVCNPALAHLPVWSVCVYDTRALSDAVLDTARATHPYLRRNVRRSINPDYVSPGDYLRELADPAVLALETTPPTRTWDGISSPAQVREVREQLGRLLDALAEHEHARQQGFVLAVHEVVDNALRHGEPPVTVRAWLTDTDLVCAVTDQGAGLTSPFPGFVRHPDALGLWIARQVCDELDVRRDGEGFTVRVRTRR